MTPPVLARIGAKVLTTLRWTGIVVGAILIPIECYDAVMTSYVDWFWFAFALLLIALGWIPDTPSSRRDRTQAGPA